MNFRLTSVLTVGFVLVALAAHAEAPTVKKPLGTWERKDNSGTKIQFHFAADHLVATLEGDGGSFKVVAHADYGLTKDGTLFGIVTKVDKDGADKPAVGDLFSFQIVLDKDKLTISNPRAGDGEGNRLLAGDYKLVPEKK